jgi:hypothetical protein
MNWTRWTTLAALVTAALLSAAVAARPERDANPPGSFFTIEGGVVGGRHDL